MHYPDEPGFIVVFIEIVTNGISHTLISNAEDSDIRGGPQLRPETL